LPTPTTNAAHRRRRCQRSTLSSHVALSVLTGSSLHIATCRLLASWEEPDCTARRPDRHHPLEMTSAGAFTEFGLTRFG
jgi:hypothetical protein